MASFCRPCLTSRSSSSETFHTRSGSGPLSISFSPIVIRSLPPHFPRSLVAPFPYLCIVYISLIR